MLLEDFSDFDVGLLEDFSDFDDMLLEAFVEAPFTKASITTAERKTVFQINFILFFICIGTWGRM